VRVGRLDAPEAGVEVLRRPAPLRVKIEMVEN
jgi:hypothetical protein